ncbi:MAG: alpha/beta hydrolase [Candidatus Micrarchaeota archaeon]
MEKTFEFDFDGMKLRGVIGGRNETRALVIICHGFLLSKNSNVPKSAFNFLVEKGFRVISFDFPGCGASEGSFRDTTISRNANAILKLVETIKQQKLAEPSEVFLLGHSMGAAACAYAATFVKFKGLVLFSTPLTWMAQKEFEDNEYLEKWKRDRVVSLLMQRKNQLVELGYQYYEDAVGKKVVEHIAKSQTPCFIVQGQGDCITDQRAIFELLAASTEGSLGLIVPKADHSFRNAGLNLALEQCTKWMQK